MFLLAKTLFLLTFAIDPAPASPLLEYTVRLADPQERAVDVALRLSGLADAPEEIELALPDRFAFVKLDEPLLDGPVRLEGGPATIERSSPFAWKLRRGGADEVRLAWRVPHRFHDIPEVRDRDAYEFPYVADDHAFLVMATLLIAPKLASEPKATVRFEAPEGWPVFCPWPRGASGAYEPATSRELGSDLVGLGKFSSRRVSAGGMEIDVAFAPGQEKLEAMAGPAIEKIVAAELALFGRAPRERYLFVFVAPRPVSGFMFAGSPKTGSMTLQVSGDASSPKALEMVAHLVAHEFHHTWAQAGCDLPDELRFVNEGFTDWYALQVPARCGIVSWETFAEQLGEKIGEYLRTSRAHGLSLAEAGGPKFFEGGDAYSTVYSGGLLVAAVLDLELRRAGKADGLDGFLRRFVNDERFWPHRAPPSLADFLAAIEAETSKAVRDRVEKMVGAASGFDPVAEFAASGVTVAAKPTARTLRANFDPSLRITGIDPASEAYALGLRSGDALKSVNGVEVKDAGAVQKAWAAPKDGTVSVVLERAGKGMELRSAPLEPPVRYAFDPAPWKR